MKTTNLKSELKEVMCKLYENTDKTFGELHTVLDDFNCDDKRFKKLKSIIENNIEIIPELKKLYLRCLEILLKFEKIETREWLIALIRKDLKIDKM